MIDTLINLYDDFTKKGRVEDLQQLSREYGFNFKKRASFGSQPTELKVFKAFSKKGSKRMLGVLELESELFKGNLRFYDYVYTKDLETKSHSIIEIRCDQFFADAVMIQPASTFKKIKGFFSSTEKQFPNLTEFYQLFDISASSKDGTLWLNEKALDRMCKFPGITMEAEGNYFLFYYPKTEIKLQEVMPVVEFAEEFVKLTCFDRSADYV